MEENDNVNATFCKYICCCYEQARVASYVIILNFGGEGELIGDLQGSRVSKRVIAGKPKTGNLECGLKKKTPTPKKRYFLPKEKKKHHHTHTWGFFSHHRNSYITHYPTNPAKMLYTLPLLYSRIDRKQ